MNNNFIYHLIATILALCTIATSTTRLVLADSSLSSNLQKLKISPEIIVDPDQTIKVELNGNIIKPGDPVPAKNFRSLDMNKISWTPDSSHDIYTLLLLDLDRKLGSNGTQSVYNQYTSINIQGSAINTGQAIVAFEPPSVPCQLSTKHRILMLAFSQRQSIDLQDIIYISAAAGRPKNRENFNLNNFIARHGLSLQAANVFLAIGESNGTCSGSATIHSLYSLSYGLIISMVMALVTLRLTSKF